MRKLGFELRTVPEQEEPRVGLMVTAISKDVWLNTPLASESRNSTRLEGGGDSSFKQRRYDHETRRSGRSKAGRNRHRAVNAGVPESNTISHAEERTIRLGSRANHVRDM